MIRVAIVEDDPASVRQLEEYLEKYAGEHGVSFKVDSFGDGDAIVERFPADYDILFMDIELPFMNGMEAAEEIRRIDGEVEIIFVTNSAQYALQGYRVGALDYILKPIVYYSFEQSLRRALENRDRSRDRWIMVNVKGGKQKISIRSIRYVEIQDHDLTFHTTQGDIRSKGTIRDVKLALPEDQFFHCNKGYLINLAFVDGITGQDIRIGSETIPVGRSKKKAFLDALNRYSNGSGE